MKYLAVVFLITCSFISKAQEEASAKDIVAIVDDLRYKWDKEAVDLGRYIGLKYYCTADVYRDRIITLLDKIHHYDTLLYGVVNRKYESTKDKEAKNTIKDIITLEADYTTLSFKEFLEKECGEFKEAEDNLSKASGSKYYDEVARIEKELGKYVKSVTQRIDIVDDHIHHIKFD